MREFINCKPGKLVFSTKHEELVVQLVKHVGNQKELIEYIQLNVEIASSVVPLSQGPPGDVNKL